MPIFVKRKTLKSEKKSKLDKYRGQWVAVKGQDKVIAYGKTIEDIIDYVKAEGKTIEDSLPDIREQIVAVKLPK